MNRLLAFVISLVLLCSCASNWRPIPIGDVDFLSRAVTQEDNQIIVSAAVPSASESVAIFGADLYRRGVQPVWLDIRNNSAEAVSFLPFGLDPYYFTPLETASMNKFRKQKSELEHYFFDSGVDPEVAPGQERKGFVFTHVDEGTKIFNVDLVGNNSSWHRTFFIQVPGLKVDHYDIDFDALLEAENIRELSESELIEYLATSPCCVRNEKGSDTGDPLNIAVVGSPDDIYYAFIRAGWDETETVKLSSSLKMLGSLVTGGEYRYSPVSDLYVFGRAQDVAFQKARKNINERNHLRLWMTPVSYEGEPVWIGQISRDIGIRFTKKTITTHKIDANVDETREYLVENLAYNQVLEKFAYVGGVGEAPIDTPRANLTGDPYFTDGQRVVMWVSVDSIALDDIRLLDWPAP